MSNNEFILNIIAALNKQLSKAQLKKDLKSIDNSLSVKVIAKLATTISQKQLKASLKQLNNLYVQVGTKFKTDKNAKNALLGEIEQLQKNLTELQLKVNVGHSATKDVISSVVSAVKIAQRYADKTAVTLDIEVRKEKAINDIVYLGQRYSKLFSDTSASKKYENLLNSAYSISDKSKLQEVRTQISAFTSDLKAHGLAVQSTADKWKKLTERAKDLFSAASIVRTVFLQTKQAISTTIDLDKVYTDLVKVQSELTRNDYPEYLERCNKKAQELATSQKALIEGAEEFSKSGYDFATSNKLTEKSMVLSNVGEMSASDSAKAIISGIQSYDDIGGYTDTIGKASALIDRYNRLGNEASITTAELAKGVQSVGAVFADANTSVDEFLALLSAGNRQYQNADSLALALRTSALRIRSATTELEDAGEDIDGVMSTLENQKAIKALTGVDILESDQKTIRSIYDIFLDISKVYKDMSDTDQSALLDILAGKHRASAISATLNNMTEAEELLQKSINSAGSAQREYDVYLESTSAHLQQFQAKLVETYSTFMNGDMISYAADIGTAILDIVNKTDLLKHGLVAIATIKIGHGITAVGGAIASTVTQIRTLGSAIQQINDLPLDDVLKESVLKEVGQATQNLTEKNLKLLLSLEKLGAQDKVLILRQHNLSEEEARTKLETMGLTTAANANIAANTANASSVNRLKGVFTGLTVSVKATWAAMSMLQKASIIFAAISTVWSVTSSIMGGFKQKQEEAKQALEDAVSEYNSAKSSLESVNNELEEQNKKLDELLAKDKLTYAEKGQLEELQAITKELLIQQDIEERRAANASKEAAKKTVDAYEKQYGGYDNTEEQLRERLSYENFPMPEGIDDVLGMVAAYMRAKELLVQSQEDFDEALKNGKDTTLYYADVQRYIDMADDYRHVLDNNISDLQEKRIALDDEYNKAIEKSVSGLEPLTSSEKEIIETYESIDDLMKIIYEYTDPTTWKSMQIENVFNTKDIEKTKEELIKMVKAGSLDDDTILSYSKLSDALDENGVSVSELRNELEALAEAENNARGGIFNDGSAISFSFTESQSKSIDDFQSKIKTLSTTLSNLRDGSYQESDFVDLIQEFPELQDKSENLEKAIIELINKSINELYNTLGKNLPDNVKNSLQSIAEEAVNVGKAIDSIKDLSTALGDLDSAHGLLETLKDDIEANNSISISTLKKIVDMYPELTDQVVEYQTGLLSVEELYDSFDGMYKKDLHNYSLYLAEKNGENETWYKNVVDGLSDELKSKAKYYGIDLDNYSNYQKAKLEIDKKYAQMHTELEQKKLDLERQNIVKESEKKKYISTVRDADQGRRINPSLADFDEIVEAEDNIEELTSIVGTAQKELDEYSEFLEEFDTSIAFSFDFDDMFKSSDGSKSSSSTSDFSNQIDWAAQSIDILERKVSTLQTALDNTKGYKAQISAINKLLKEQENLVSGYEKAQNTYQSKYNDVLTTGVIAKNGLSNKIRSQIENGETFNIEDFIDKNVSSDNTGIREQLYDAINDAIDWYNKSNDAEDNAVKIRAEINEASFTKLGLQIEEWEKQVELSKDKIDLYTENLSVQTDFNSKLVEQEKKRYSLLIQQARKEKDYTKAKQLEVEQQKTLLELTKEQFDRINNYYDNKLGSLNSKTSKMNAAMSLVEAQGSSAGIGFYNRINNINEYSIDYLETERDKLRESMGSIKLYTDEWYNALKTLNDVEEQIIELNTSISENNNQIKQMNWDRFDQLSDKIQSLNDERDFIDDLLGSYEKIDEKTGKLTSYGVSSNALHLANYDTYMYKAEQLANEIAALDAEYADDKNNSFYLEQRDNLISQRYDAIRAAQSERETVIDLIKDGINAEISATEKLVNAKKEALSAEQELHDYQKSIAEKTNDINMIQRQINALEGDDSLENQKKLRELRSQLKDTKDDLEETQYDHSISEQQDALDKMLEDYKASMEEYMKNTDALLAKSIAQVNVESGNVADTLEEVTGNIGYDISENVIEPWKESSDVISNYKTTFESASASTLTNLGLMKTAWKELNDQIDTYSKDATSALYSEDKNDHLTGKGGNTSNTTNIDKNALSGKDSSGSYKKNTSSNDKKDNDTLSEVKQICASASAKSDGNAGTEINKYILAHQSELGGNGNKLTWKQMVNLADVLGIKTDISKVSDTSEIGKSVRKEILKKLKSVTGFSTGGIVKVMGNDDGLVKLKAGETVLTDAFTSILPEAVNVMKNFTLDIPNIMKNVQFVNPVQQFMQHPISVGDITIQLDGSNVMDAKTFSDCLNKNKEYIQHMVWDVPLGRGELNYNKYKRV